MNIGIAGTGRMGTAVARRLLATGHEVRVWNRTFEHAAEARQAGAIWSASPGELVNDSQLLISFLFDNAAAESVYLGANGLLSGRAGGRLFIDMSTVSPEVHGRIALAVESRQAGFLECPVSGSIAAARAGELVGFAGGESADFARARPVLELLCRRVELVGPLGKGIRMKLAANLLLVVFWQALGEALLLIDPSSMGMARALELLADSNIGAAILRMRGPQIIAALNGGGSAAASFDVNTMHKDLRYMAQEGGAHGGWLPLVDRTLACFDLAAREGGGNVDGADYPAYWLERQQAVADGLRPALSRNEGMRR